MVGSEIHHEGRIHVQLAERYVASALLKHRISEPREL
jgi:hypothetical protein